MNNNTNVVNNNTNILMKSNNNFISITSIPNKYNT